MFNLFCEYTNLEYVRVPVINRPHQAEYVIHIRVAASQEYVNTYSTRRPSSSSPASFWCDSIIICMSNEQVLV